MTKADLKEASNPFPQLFAYGIDADCHKISSSASGFTYESGIPSAYSSLQGKKVCRGDINGIGRAITQSKWFNQLGGYYTFSREVSDFIGGYPLGAILYYKDDESGYVRVVRSLIPDNEYDFVENPEFINNEYWSYVDNVIPVGFRPRIFPAFSDPAVKTGTLRVNEEVTADCPSLFMIQTGCDSMDSTEGESDYFLYATVRRYGETEFYTAGLVCYLPSEPYIITQGVKTVQECDFAPVDTKAFHAYNAPSPIQFYLLGGDTVKLSGNMNFPKIESEVYSYWIFPLVP